MGIILFVLHDWSTVLLCHVVEPSVAAEYGCVWGCGSSGGAGIIAATGTTAPGGAEPAGRSGRWWDFTHGHTRASTCLQYSEDHLKQYHKTGC